MTKKTAYLSTINLAEIARGGYLAYYQSLTTLPPAFSTKKRLLFAFPYPRTETPDSLHNIQTQNHNIMNKKTYFEAPSAELIVVRFEENIMSFDSVNHTENVVEDEYEQLG